MPTDFTRASLALIALTSGCAAEVFHGDPIREHSRDASGPRADLGGPKDGPVSADLASGHDGSVAVDLAVCRTACLAGQCGNVANGCGGVLSCGVPALPPPDPPVPPPMNGCPLVLDADHYLVIAPYQYGANIIDTNSKWCGPAGTVPPPGWDGPCGTKCCKLGVEGGTWGLPCEAALIGQPVFKPVCGAVSLSPLPNPFMRRFSGQGIVQVCSQIVPDACGLYLTPP